MRPTAHALLLALLLAVASAAQEPVPPVMVRDLEPLRAAVHEAGSALAPGSDWPDYVRRAPDGRPYARLEVGNSSGAPLDLAAITSAALEELRAANVAFAAPDDPPDGSVCVGVGLGSLQTTASSASVEGSIWFQAAAKSGSSGKSGPSFRLELVPGDWRWLDGQGWTRGGPHPDQPGAGSPAGFVDEATFLAQEGLPELGLCSGIGELSVSADGRLALTSSSQTVNLWQLEPTGLQRCLARLRGPGTWARHCALHPSGRLAVVLDGEGQGIVWAVEPSGRTREVQRLALPSAGSPVAATFSRDGARLLVGFDAARGQGGQVRELAVDLDAPAPLTPDRTWPTQALRPWVMVPSPDGSRVVVGGWDADGGLWDARSDPPRRLATLGPVGAAAFSADGSRLATASKGSVRLWSLGPAGPAELASAEVPLFREPGNDGGVTRLVLRDDALIAGTTRGLHGWSVGQGGALGERRALEGGFMGYGLQSAGELLVEVYATPRLARLGPGPSLARLSAPSLERLGAQGQQHTVLAVSPDGRWVAVGRDALTLHRTGLREGQGWSATVAALPRRDAILAMAFAPDAERLAIGHAGGVELWRVTDAGPMLAGTYEAKAPRRLQFLADGRLLVVADGGVELLAWDGSRPPLRIAVEGDAWSTDVVATASGHLLAKTVERESGTFRRRLLAWSLADGRPLKLETPELDVKTVRQVTLSEAGVVALDGPGRVGLLRLEVRGAGLILVPAGEVPTQPGEYPPPLTISRDGRWLLVPGLEDSLERWWIGDAHMARVSAHRTAERYGGIPSLRMVTADGGWLVAVGQEHGVEAWRLAGERAITIAGDALRWGAPAAPPPGQPRLTFSTRTEKDRLVVEVANEGDAPAYLVRGTAERLDDPVASAVELVVGTVPAGGKVTRRVALSAGARLGEPTWRRAWGEEMKSARPTLAGRSRAELAALAAREARALPEAYIWREELLQSVGALLVAVGADRGALAIAEALGEFESRNVRSALADARADRGDLEGAEEALAPRERSAWRRQQLQARSKRVAVRAAPLADALTRAAEIIDPVARSAEQVEVARRHAQAGDAAATRRAIEGATESVRAAAGYAFTWIKAGVAVALAAHGLGLKDEATALLEELLGSSTAIEKPWDRAFCCRELGLGFARLALRERSRAAFAAARSAVPEIDERNRTNALSAIAETEAEAGSPNALQAAEAAMDPDDDFGNARADEARLKVGLAQLERGEVAAALATAAAIRDFEQYRTELLARIGQRLAAEGKVDEALAVIDQQEQGSAKAAAYLDLARAQVFAGAREAALETARRASFLREGYRGFARGEPGTAFDLDDPATWDLNYESTGFSSAGIHAMESSARAELRGAAMRLRLALGWKDTDRFARAVDGDRAEERVSTYAALHGQLGERADAEGWIERLNDPRARVWAILNLARGLGARR